LNCGTLLDGVKSISGDDVSHGPGDITVCFTCGHIMAFAEDMNFRALTDDEIRMVAGDRRIVLFNKLREDFL
jgi:hypothetical protein